MVAFSTFRFSKFDPFLIFSQIGAVQCLGYTFIGLLFRVMSNFNEINLPISLMFEEGLMSTEYVKSWKLFLIFISGAVFNSFMFMFIVERGRSCLDFSITFCFVHFLITCFCSASFPIQPLWWLLLFIFGTIMAVLGRFLCQRRELLPISVAKTVVSPSISSVVQNQNINRSSFEIDSDYEMDNLLSASADLGTSRKSTTGNPVPQDRLSNGFQNSNLEYMENKKKSSKLESSLKINSKSKDIPKRNTTEAIRQNLLADMNESLLEDQIDITNKKPQSKDKKSLNSNNTTASVSNQNQNDNKLSYVDPKDTEISFDNSDWGDDDSWGLDDDEPQETFTSKKKD
ncbi:Protein SYS1-like protein [Smittium culicis]|uniref:Protein SYS1-like protein n=1 Tax=Smittium culicis TaxID=133412 RepID=A0A1R1XAX0_9FUNG|nr:Protein SYS1-like protein [Smittium culicis]